MRNAFIASISSLAPARSPVRAMPRPRVKRISESAMGYWLGVHRQRGSAGPIRPFQDIARRHRGLGGEIDEVDRTIAAVGGGERLLVSASALASCASCRCA